MELEVHYRNIRIPYNNMNLFQDKDVWGVSIKNYTQSVLEEVASIRKDQKNVSNLITVVIGEYICIMFQNFPYFI
jgi:hypothetical protein